jgi:hypothetical protein
MSRLISGVIITTCTFLFMTVSILHASESEGTISNSEYRSRVCKNSICSSFGNINWKPTGATPIVISDSGISGYAWGDEIGWINFDLEDTAVTIDADTGVLSGYAYANSGGWINFSPTTVSGGEAVGVTIENNGDFDGWAWVSGAYGGWMKFDCATSATCVSTDWRPISQRGLDPVDPEDPIEESLNNRRSSLNQNVIVTTTTSHIDIYRFYDLIRRILELMLQIERINQGIELEVTSSSEITLIPSPALNEPILSDQKNNLYNNSKLFLQKYFEMALITPSSTYKAHQAIVSTSAHF